MIAITKPDIYECFYLLKTLPHLLSLKPGEGKKTYTTDLFVCLPQPLSNDKWTIKLNCCLFPPGMRHYTS